MITEENLSMLYNDVIDGDELSTKVLNTYGFTPKDLNDLIKDGTIKRVKRGVYEINSVEKLFNYGTTLRINKEYEKANLCFEKCFELDPNNYDVYSQLFLNAVRFYDYDKAYRIYDHVLSLNNPRYIVDYNYYLYLLSFITDLPDKYKDYIKYLNMEYIKIDDKDERYENVEEYNKSRFVSLRKKFTYSLELLHAANPINSFQEEESSIEYYIVTLLLSYIIKYEEKCKSNLIKLIQEKQYQDAIKFLERKELRHILSRQDEYTLKLLKEYISIKNTREIPVSSISNNTTNLYNAIDNKDYELSLKLCNSHNAEHNIDGNTNLLTIVLNDICTLIGEIKEEDSEIIKNSDDEVVKVQTEKVEININEKVKAEPKVNNVSGSFASIVSNLMSKNIDKAIEELNKYMASINCSKYNFLIIDLINLSLLENDISFSKPMLALTMVSRNDYTFDISSYIQEFYINLSQNKFENARIYLDIISKGNTLGQDCILTDGLVEVLNQTEKSFGYVHKPEITFNNNPYETESVKTEQFTDEVEEAEVNQLADIVEEVDAKQPADTIKTPEISLDEEVKKSIKNNPIERVHQPVFADNNDIDEEFIEKKHEELIANRGILMLKPMNQSRRTKIHGLVRKYLDIESFEIGKDDKIQIVLRYKNKTFEYVDFKSLIEEGNLAYRQNDYDKSIECFSQLLENGNPKSFVYLKLGLAYMKKMEIDKAISYFTVADELAKKEGNDDINLENLILRLKGEIEEEDIKPNVKMTQSDFNYDEMSDYYGINNFDEINSYIIESGLDVETACINLGFSMEQINKVKLIYARMYYSQKEFDRGDLFLRSVELSRDKTQEIISIYNRVRRNKKFYFNRVGANGYHISLKLKPKK